MNKKERIGVYICHCGGNISDYVDVAKIKDLVGSEDGVMVSKNVMFACADSNQKEMIRDIKERNLDGIVVASCSPKLHLHTFRNVAKRAGINPYNYTQVNIREQCSWAHSDTPSEATVKALGLIRAGIRKVSYSEALESIEVASTRAVVVIGAGISGMRAAIGLADMGNEVYLVEKAFSTGGHVAKAGELFTTGQNGTSVADELLQRVRRSTSIHLFTSAEVEKVTGSLGNFIVRIKTGDESLNLKAGAILVATGFDDYIPSEGEFGYNRFPNIITLPEFRELTKNGTNGKGSLVLNNKKINSIAYIYCVGMRQSKGANKYCSRVCCTAAIHSSILTHEKFPGTRVYHLYRDIRTYGKQEILYERASKNGDIFMKYDEKFPPTVEEIDGKLNIRIKDELTRKQEIEFEADLVVLVTGMVPRNDSSRIAEQLKIPVGNDKFFNEIHPKLRPVETVINGVFLGGSCQGPRNISESVQSAMSASVKINALTKNPTILLEPIVARVNADACAWCDKCTEVCEYDAIHPEETAEGKKVAAINEAVCKGCGICAPVCPTDAIYIAQYSNPEVEGMIDGFMEIAETGEAKEEAAVSIPETTTGMKDMPALWRRISALLADEPRTIPALARELSVSSNEVTYHLMTMNKYNIVEAAGIDDTDEYYIYKLKNAKHAEN